MRIQDLMSRSVVHVSPTTSVAVAREMLLSGEIGHLVVMDGKHLAGVLSERDLSGQAGERPVSEVMSRQVVTIDPEATLRRAAGVMRGRAVGCLPVVEDGRLVGIVTTSDFLTAIAKGETHAPPRARTTLRRPSRKRPSAIT
jgi:acetoin utilization protein AcuB